MGSAARLPWRPDQVVEMIGTIARSRMNCLRLALNERTGGCHVILLARPSSTRTANRTCTLEQSGHGIAGEPELRVPFYATWAACVFVPMMAEATIRRSRSDRSNRFEHPINTPCFRNRLPSVLVRSILTRARTNSLSRSH